MDTVREALQARWTRLFVRALALVLVYGGLVHLANMAGLAGTPWSETPLTWRVLDVVLLVFDVVVASGLWRYRPWAVVAFVAGILMLQVLPYSLFGAEFARTPEQQAALTGLIVTWLLVLAMLLALVGYRK